MKFKDLFQDSASNRRQVTNKYNFSSTQKTHMKALVLGGTGFIGRRLVDNLIKENWDVTIATSGRSPNPFGDAVSSVVFDRFRITSLEEKLSSPPYFDVLFDQICFGPDDAAEIADSFGGRIGHYVFVSSGSVYPQDQPVYVEEDFDPYQHEIQKGGMGTLGYGEGKRSAEAYFFQKSDFPVAAARFPIVVGHDDSTTRFQKLVQDVLDGNEILVPPGGGKKNYVWVEDAGRFLMWLGKNGKKGPFNASSSYALDAVEMIDTVSKVTGKEANIIESSESMGPTSYYTSEDHLYSPAKAEKEGFEFTPFRDWIEDEIRLTVENRGKSPNSMEYFSRKINDS